MSDKALNDKLRRVLDFANGSIPDGDPNEWSGHKRLVRALESLTPAFWDLEIDTFARIIEEAGHKNLPGRVMEADPQALGLEIRRQRPQYLMLYQDPDYLERLRIRNTPFEELIEQRRPGLLRHVVDFMDRLQSLGLHSEYETKRRTDSVEVMHAGIVVSRVNGAENTPILHVSDYGKIVCRSVQTGSMKPFLTAHVIELSQEFDCPLGYDHEEWLFTSEELQNFVNHSGYANLEEAMARRPGIAPFVSVDITSVLPDRADYWIGLVGQLLQAIDQKVPSEGSTGLRVGKLAKPSDLYFPK